MNKTLSLTWESFRSGKGKAVKTVSFIILTPECYKCYNREEINGNILPKLLFRKMWLRREGSREEQRDEGGSSYFTVRMNECRVVAMLSSQLPSTSRSDSRWAVVKEQFLPFSVHNEPPASLGPLNLSGCQSRDPCDMKGDLT